MHAYTAVTRASQLWLLTAAVPCAAPPPASRGGWKRARVLRSDTDLSARPGPARGQAARRSAREAARGFRARRARRLARAARADSRRTDRTRPPLRTAAAAGSHGLSRPPPAATCRRADAPGRRPRQARAAAPAPASGAGGAPRAACRRRPRGASSEAARRPESGRRAARARVGAGRARARPPREGPSRARGHSPAGWKGVPGLARTARAAAGLRGGAAQRRPRPGPRPRASVGLCALPSASQPLNVSFRAAPRRCTPCGS
ncbi:hypothetical protein EMCLV093L [Equine molluscum contagiosum-like virus]|nr:hypothetical protein EMCLV093L [Equine molluscum contagiosum-like virus]